MIWVGTVCSLYQDCVFTMPGPCVHYTRTVCLLYQDCVFAIPGLCVHYTSTVCSLCQYCVFTIPGLCVHYARTVCSLCRTHQAPSYRQYHFWSECGVDLWILVQPALHHRDDGIFVSTPTTSAVLVYVDRGIVPPPE